MVWLLSSKSTTIVQGDHEMVVEFSTLHRGSRAASEIEIQNFRRDNFSLFKDLLGRIPWEQALQRRGVQERWSINIQASLPPGSRPVHPDE